MAHQNGYTLLAAQEIIMLINTFSSKVLTFRCCTVARMFTSDSILGFRVRTRARVMTLCVNPSFPGFEWWTRRTHSSCAPPIHSTSWKNYWMFVTLNRSSSPCLLHQLQDRSFQGCQYCIQMKCFHFLCTIYPVASSNVFVYKKVNLQPMGWVHPRTARNVNQHFCKWQHPLAMSKGWTPWH